MAEETQEGRTFLAKNGEASEKRSAGPVACVKTLCQDRGQQECQTEEGLSSEEASSLSPLFHSSSPAPTPWSWVWHWTTWQCSHEVDNGVILSTPSTPSPASQWLPSVRGALPSLQEDTLRPNDSAGNSRVADGINSQASSPCTFQRM